MIGMDMKMRRTQKLTPIKKYLTVKQTKAIQNKIRTAREINVWWTHLGKNCYDTEYEWKPNKRGNKNWILKATTTGLKRKIG